MYKTTLIIGTLLLLLLQGCNQPNKEEFEVYYKQKMESVIWDGVHYNTDEYAQEASRTQNQSISLDSSILRLNIKQVKHLTKYLDFTPDSLSRAVPVAKVYHGFKSHPFTLLSNKVENIIVTYVDDKLAHIYVSLVRKRIKKNKLSDTQIRQAVIKRFGIYDKNLKEVYMNTVIKKDVLGDIKDRLNNKFGQPFYYGVAEANNDSNDVYTWGMHNNFYYKVVVNDDEKYAYLSIKSKAFMKMLGENIVDVKKWQRKQNGIAESMVTVH